MIDAICRGLLRCAFLAQLCVHAVLRPRVVGAHVVVRFEDRVLLVKNSYRRARGFPAGRVDRGEGVRAAAARELREEVGIEVDEGRLIPLAVVVTRHEFKTDEAHLFELRLDERPVVTIDRREVVWADFVPIEAIDFPLHAPARRWLEGERRGGRDG